MHILAIIPARGGSKGIPGKNLVRVGGAPLIAHVLRAAQASRRITRRVVSTDSDEIARAARAEGAEPVLRPAALSGDTASSETALLHVLDELDRTEGYRPDLVVFLQCTSPLTTAADIDGTVDMLLQEQADSALSVAPFHYFLWQRDPAGAAIGINHDKAHRARRQDREPQFVETGGVYVMRTAGFQRSKHRFFGRTVFHVVPAEHLLEIDEPYDLRNAEAALRERQSAASTAALPPVPAALIFDFDGVFTDNRVLVSEAGTEAVWCDRSDGLGLEQARSRGWRMLVLSKEKNPVVAARCRKLQLECLQGVDHKAPALQGWMRQHGVDPQAAVYVGNDVNDLECMRLVGVPVAVADAHPAVLAAARLVLHRPGGRGAIRELIELIEARPGATSSP